MHPKRLKNLKHCLHKADNQKGQAIIELTMMMPFLAVILMALVVIWEISTAQVDTLIKVRHEMREAVDRGSPYNFRRGVARKRYHVDIPGKMKWWLGRPFISQEFNITYYTGSWHGKRLNAYHNWGKTRRTINR